MFRFLTALGLVCASIGAPAAARAQDEAPGSVARVVGERPAPWIARLESLAAVDVASLPRASAGHALERVRGLRRVEGMVGEARRAAAQLDEARALAILTDARQRVEALTDLPGSSEWLAEVELALGVAAAQAGLQAIANESFGRAASLNPERSIAAAEAAPSIVARARAAIAAERQRPFGVVAVSGPAGARVFVDDRLEGRAPVEARVRAGRHVVRVEAAGHRAWGSAVDVLPGSAPAFAVRLSPTRAELARRSLLQQESFDASFLASAAAGLGRPVRWIEVTEQRAFVVTCTAEGCGAPERWSEEGLAPLPLEPGDAAAQMAQARAWMGAPAWEGPGGNRPPPRRPWWRRWGPWALAGLAVAAGAVGAGVALRPERSQRLHVLVDPGDLQ